MPHATTRDNVRIYFEEAGRERRSFFCTNSRPTTPIGSRRCVTSRAATAASPIRRAATRPRTCRHGEVYTYKHFYTDALAVLDHLKIERAHLVGLSMGAYSSLQIGLNAPQRALSMTLAGVGSGSELENLEAWRKQCRANAEQFETLGSAEVAKVTREAPSRIPFLVKDPRGHADFYAALARHDSKGSANTMRGFQGGRPSIYTMTDAIRKASTPALIICGDEDDPCVGAEPVLEAASAGGRARDVSEVGPRAQPRRARAVQRDGGAVRDAGGSRAVAGARSEVAGGALDAAHRYRSAASRAPESPADQDTGLRSLTLGCAIALSSLIRAHRKTPADVTSPRPGSAENTPCSPNMFQTHHGSVQRQRPAVEIERHGALHLDVDLVAELRRNP